MELISREAAIEALTEMYCKTDEEGYVWIIRGDACLRIDALPSVDAVEVVRCKDCKYAEVADTEDSQDGYTCQFHRGSIWFSGSYCSWAERRTDG